jgi:ubiquinone/menaquinone biosynthesis C-methylase UbiE
MSTNPLLLFGSTAEQYERYRPEYPAALFEHIRREARTGQACVVLDVAAGTGKLTRGFAPMACRLVALEPDRAMREVGEKTLREKGIVCRWIDAPAEETGLPDSFVHLVTSAQAYHWFDKDKFLREVHRILHKSGSLALFNYIPPTAEGEIGRWLKEEYFPKWNPQMQFRKDIKVEEELKASGLFENVRSIPIDWINPQPLEQFIGYVATHSWIQTYLSEYPNDTLLSDYHQYLKPHVPSDGLIRLHYHGELTIGVKN